VDSQALFLEEARRRVLRNVEAFERGPADSFERADETPAPPAVEETGS
jgi:hypothetical protein